MKSVIGLTLIEVLIAIVVLAVGVLAAAAMQTTALRASSDAKAIQDVTEFAEREIELLRQSEPSPGTKDCSKSPYTCTAVVRACQLSSSNLTCAGTGTDAHQITVTVTGPREKTITLKTVKAGS